MDKISLLIHGLEQAKSISESEGLIEELAKLGEPVIQRLHDEYLTAQPVRKGKRIHVIMIYQKMGYPANRTSIPFLVDIVSDINSPGWELAVQELVKIGAPAIPKIKEALRYYSDDYVENDSAYQGLCALLKEIGTPVINPVKPELVILADEGTKSIHSYVYEVLDLIENSKT